MAITLCMTSNKGPSVWFCIECNGFDWQMVYLEGCAACTAICCEHTTCRGLHVQITQYCMALNLTVWTFIGPKDGRHSAGRSLAYSHTGEKV